MCYLSCLLDISLWSRGENYLSYTLHSQNKLELHEPPAWGNYTTPLRLVIIFFFISPVAHANTVSMCVCVYIYIYTYIK